MRFRQVTSNKGLRWALYASGYLLIVWMMIAFGERGCAFYVSRMAPYPDGWLRVKPGMSTTEARERAGEPWADGKHVKILDRWRDNVWGVELHMDIWFDPFDYDHDRIQGVHRWKQFQFWHFEEMTELSNNETR